MLCVGPWHQADAHPQPGLRPFTGAKQIYINRYSITRTIVRPGTIKVFFGRNPDIEASG
jgi:hypothetical protein